MDTFWTSASGWWVQAVLSGGAVLLLGWLGTLVFRRPALRQTIGAWAVRGAVIAAVLSALPSWVLLPRPAWMEPPAVAEVSAEPSPEPEPSLPPVVVEVERQPVNWVFVPQEAAAPSDPTPAVETTVTPEPESKSEPEADDSRVPSEASVVPLLLSVYFVVAGALLLQLIGERLALAWLLRDAAPLVGRARWVLEQLTAGEPLPVAYASHRVRSPLCVGFFRPVLVLPKGLADSADVSMLRWALAHELHHLRRGDTRTSCWVGVARAVFFFVPWFWLLRRDLGLCQEYLADAAAATAGGAPADYAAFLVDLSGGRHSRRSLAAARMNAGKSDLFRRVHMLLNVKSATRGVSRGFAAVAGTAAVAGAIGLSGLGFADEPKKEIPKPTVRVIQIEKVEDADEKKGEEPEPKQLQWLVKPLRGNGEVDEKVLVDLIKMLEKDGALDPGTLQQMMKAREGMLELLNNPNVMQLRLQPPVEVIRGGARVAPAESELRKQYEQQLKNFEEQIKNAPDAEAKAQLEKTRDEYKKAMEEPLKKAEAAREDLNDARRRLEEAERANRLQNQDAMRRLVEMQQQMQRRLMEDMRQLEGREGFRWRVQPFAVGPDGRFTPFGGNGVQPRLGVQVDKVSAVLAEQLDLPKDSGVVIAEVTPGSAAEKAGLKANDVLLQLAGKDVPTDPVAFTAMVGKLEAGEKIDAVVLRKGKKETVTGIELPETAKPNRGDFGDPFGGIGGNANESVQVQISNGDVTLQATVDGVGYTVTGTTDGGKLLPSKIVVKDGKESKEYESLDKMPEAERATVERLMGKVRVFGGR